jgi:PAS domain S-box-containing protein
MWQAAVAAMMEGIAILDGDTYRYMNAAHAGMYGWDPEELIGRTWRELYSEPMQEWIVEHAFPSLGRDGQAARAWGCTLPSA